MVDNMKRLIAALLFTLAAPGMILADAPEEKVVDPGSFLLRIELLQSATQTYQSCCKTCRKGKACGNSCISRTKSCRVGPGCACDG